MDQVVVAMGRARAVLPILCRPASVLPPAALPEGIEIVGRPTGAEHDVSGLRTVAPGPPRFMGKRIIEDHTARQWPWVSALPEDAVAELPDALDGATFLEQWGITDDAITTVDPDETYPVRAATRFGVTSTGGLRKHSPRSSAVTPRHWVRGWPRAMRGMTPWASAIRPATAAVADVLDRPGVHGARSSGGGSGGTVVVVCDRGALDDVDDLIR